MRKSSLLAAVLVALLTASLLSPVAATRTGEPGPAQTDDEVLVVDDDGSAEYDSIQAAVDAAGEGDTVEVRPGTYREQVTIEENVTVVAPDGATMNGSEFDRLSHAFRIEAGVVPVIEGFTIRDYDYGVNAERAPRMGVTGSTWEVGWTVRKVTFLGCREEAINAGNSKADWTVENVYIEGQGGYVGITTFGSVGDWTIRNVAIRDVAFDGIHLGGSSGNWTIRNVSVVHAGDGIDVGASDGNGTIRDSTVRNVDSGISMDEMRGNLTVTDTVIANVTHPADDPRFNGVAVHAANTSGSWRIRNSVIMGYSRYGINATGATPAGDATGNWWGSDGPGPDACLGNVRCGEGLDSRPDAGASLDDSGAPNDGRTDESDPGTEAATDSPTGRSTTVQRSASGTGTPGETPGVTGTPTAATPGRTQTATRTTASSSVSAQQTASDTDGAGETPTTTGPVSVDLLLGAVIGLAVLLGGALGTAFVRGRD